MSSRKGRPTDNPKTTEIKVRATTDDKEKLRFCCEKTGMNQYQVVMEGINRIYGELSK